MSERFKLPLTQPKISALSSGYESGSYFMMTLNDVVYDSSKIEKNKNNHHRGMNLVLVDRLTHEVTKTQSYDTWAE